ncbi:hypothetical protein AVEN_228807-1 [Araneus ventricosus]|uniref:Uncharacterized protein n=1 Tax=Araneus ventricosus TaxID=182803 RepID=A0A4Y2T2P6_ARAVE|nr:hypothetical protein AVEN_51949-1 [Araneus ventricosus]GBN94219.1 hypothetical protein AVEN_228807-1 [Araneus ventricosus]
MYSGLLHVTGVKRHPFGVARKFGEGVPAQVWSSSSDRGSKLRAPSQNSPRVPSERDVNITKLNKDTVVVVEIHTGQPTLKVRAGL